MKNENLIDLSKGFKIFEDNEAFNNSDVLIGNMYRINGCYYFKPDPKGDCIYDLRENIKSLDVE